jgi:predicted class III extradiol MEMO1 family dioxygenase
MNHLIQMIQLSSRSMTVEFVSYAQSSQCLSKDDSSVSYSAAIAYDDA